MGVRIIGTGAFIPPKTVTNDDLAKTVDTSDEWISSRTGIHNRHIADNMTTSYMASKAGKMAVADCGIDVLDIDMIIVATSSPDYPFPSTAALVQREIGALRAACFDISVACTGFIYAYSIADAYIRAGIYKNVLIIGAEVMSQHLDWSDRSVCVLFGDGAGAAVISSDKSDTVGAVTIHSDGSQADVLRCNKDNIVMDGREVFTFAVRTVPQVIMEVLQSTGTDINDVTMFILHQANRRIIEAIAKKLKVDITRFPMNLSEYGNTSAASIPILLDELKKNGRIKAGDKTIISGFGAGLSWGAILVEW